LGMPVRDVSARVADIILTLLFALAIGAEIL
jgi:hypothetical protein